MRFAGASLQPFPDEAVHPVAAFDETLDELLRAVGRTGRAEHERAQAHGAEGVFQVVGNCAHPLVFLGDDLLEFVPRLLQLHVGAHPGEQFPGGNEPPQIELGWMQEEGEHRFWIRDYGNGVPPEKRPQLFQSFHLRQRKNSPRGLGLPLVQRLMELPGGRCGYLPRDGGSDFFFTLPMATASCQVFAPHFAT